MEQSAELATGFIKKNLRQIPILSTGGYNDPFLKFISTCFNSKIVKCREYLKFVIKGIDKLNE